MSKRKIAVIAAHPDDEVLGCGATMAKHIKAGDEVAVLIMAEGLTSRDETRDRSAHQDQLSELAQAAINANKALGVTNVTLLDFPDNRMDSMDRLDVVKAVEAFVDEFRPERIYTHHSGDVNIDHQTIHYAVMTACRPLPGEPVKEVWSFEVASSTEWVYPGSAPGFLPNGFVDVSGTIGLKQDALRAYEGEMRAWPHARSYQALDALAKWRGATIGVDAAEAFVINRRIED